MAARTPEALSVYGSLLLRGAIAAAQHDQRSTAFELLAEADDAARQLGADGNFRWTAFGPVNAKMHRVNVSVALGDAGAAVDIARGIDLSAVAVTERKASLLIDVARAFLQSGRHEKAYLALRAAGETAPEEIAGRPSGRPHPQPCHLGSAEHPPRSGTVRHRGRSHPVSDGPRARVLSVIVCGAGPATAIGTLVKLSLDRGWTVQVIATPAALDFFDQAAIEGQTGTPVKSRYSTPGSPRSRIPDAIIVAPATYNTINKWALGISDTYALGVLAEMTGLGIPVVVLPFVNSALAQPSAVPAPYRRPARGRITRPAGPGGVDRARPRLAATSRQAPLASRAWIEADHMPTPHAADGDSDAG